MSPRRIDDLSHDELALLVREYLLGGHLIDRAGMPLVISRGMDVMREVAIDEWMGASPIYTDRMQRLLGFAVPTVEAALKGMQLDIGAPPEFMDFRMKVIDDHHGEFHLDHCGALLDIEPMGDAYVETMCHHIEDPTFDATGWVSHPQLRMRPVHRPPRVPADRSPHCAWTVVIDDTVEPSPEPELAKRVRTSVLAQLPLAPVEVRPGDGEGMLDYSGPLDADLRLRDFAPAVLRALVDEVAIQGHLLVLAFCAAIEDRTSTEDAVDLASRQFVGVAGVVATRLRQALGLGDAAEDVATVFSLHPAFQPRGYVDWNVEVDGDAVVLSLGDCLGRDERGFTSWITTLADGHDRALTSIAAGVDPHWTVAADGRDRWIATRGEAPIDEFSEVTLTKFSGGAAFQFVH